MQPLRAFLTLFRLALAMLALGLWLGPAAAMSQAPAAPHATGMALDGHHHGTGGAHHDGKRAGHDATACCAAACGPAVAPEAGRVEALALAASPSVRPGLDAFPPGHDPATAEPPPRAPSS